MQTSYGNHLLLVLISNKVPDLTDLKFSNYYDKGINKKNGSVVNYYLSLKIR